MGRARDAWAGAAAVAAVLALAASALVAPPEGLAEDRGDYGASIDHFPHGPHLSQGAVDAALSGGSDRECRTCHDYAKGPDAHLAGCEQCHIGEKHLATTVAPRRPGAKPFTHAEHLRDPKTTCFSCHKPVKERDWIAFSMPAAGLSRRGPSGEASCADCHRTHEPSGGKVRQDDVTGDGRTCSTCHQGAAAIVPSPPSATRGPFRHADHGGAQGACESCHAGIAASATIWDHDPVAGTAAACADCHRDAAGKPLAGVGDPPVVTQPAFVQFSNFPHGKHLAPKTGKIETSAAVGDACRTCHYPEQAKDGAGKAFASRATSAEPVGRASLVDYDTCLPCHEAWKVAGHGVGAWSCFKCHGGATGADGSLAMATSRVTRESMPGGFRAAAHAHPVVTSSGARIEGAADGTKPCSDCHKADVPALAARSAGKPFAHAPHLPADPKPADCLVCHSTAAESQWSAFMRRFDAHLGGVLSADAEARGARACLDCHVGAKPEDLGIDRATRDVPEFDHRSHVVGAVWKGGKGIACTECHAPGGPHGYGTAPDALTCVRCHSHDEAQADKYARTGKKTREAGDAAKCAACHDEPGAARAAIPPRTHLSLLPGVQHHDMSGACADCHARDGAAQVPYQVRMPKAKLGVSVHDDPALAGQWFNDPSGGPASCRKCHVNEPRGYLRALERRK
ncbi:MAG: hypothetical protein HMLKMBBP_03994 [Planctomycetes bacterium]|nr:hypothetical protein [Planctomycetota bacterium]